MSKCNDYICNICGRHVKPENNTQFKVKSSRFVDYGNYDELFADRAVWDICLDCLKEIKEKVCTQKVIDTTALVYNQPNKN